MNRNPDREEDLFAEALARPAGDRAAFLDGACNGDLALRVKLDALLAAHDRPDSLMDLPRPDVSAGTLAAAEEKSGDTIGHYKLLQKIGEGGCGVVWMAEQAEPVRRRVALKVIKLGMDTKAVVARFEAERQALAMMDHPNIAKVFDAGVTATGRPFFVMELVRGIPITRFCDDNKLALRDRLQLFIPVCHAIQHAHQKGIIHRDIKPSNVLVTLHDDVAMPMVIDFGIAKATQGRLTDQTVFTAFEQFMGTPAYMAPEQAEFNALDVDTRSDIYSLGVLLYELLVGRPPFDPRTLRKSSLEEIRKIIREQDPPRPSTRARTLTLEERTTIAHARGVMPAHLPVFLRGDLDWIVMKALEKNRVRRYQTANALAMDLHRFLVNEPIVARPPTAAYRMGKQISRHRVAFTAGSLVFVSLVAGLVVATVSWRRETAARKAAVAAGIATREAEEVAAAARVNAERLLLFVVTDLGEQLDKLGQQPLVRQLAGEVLSYYEHLNPRLQTRETRAGHALAMAGLSTAGWLSFGRSSEFVLGETRGRERLEQALDEMRNLEATGPLTPFMRAAYAGVLWGMAGQCYREGRPAAGVPLLEQAEEQLQLVTDDPQWGTWADHFRTRLIVGKGAAMISPASPVRPRGWRQAALTDFKRALVRVEEQCRAHPDDRNLRLTAIDARVRLSRALAQAEPAQRRAAIGINAIALSDARALVAQQPFLAGATMLLATAVRNHALLVQPDWQFEAIRADLDEAIAAFQEVAKNDPEMGSGGGFLPDTLVTRAEHHRTFGNFAAAEADLRAAIGMWNHPNTPPNAHLLLVRGHELLARVLAATDRDREADAQLALADAVFSRALGERPWLDEKGRTNLAFQRDLRRTAVEYERLNWRAVLAIADRVHVHAGVRDVGGDPAGPSTPSATRAQFLIAALALGDRPMVRRHLEHWQDLGATPPATGAIEERFVRLRRQLDRLDAQARTGGQDAARQELALIWPEVEAVFAAGPGHLFNQIQTARALLVRAELDGTDAEKREWRDRAAGWLRPAAAQGRLTRAERELLLARVEERLATVAVE